MPLYACLAHCCSKTFTKWGDARQHMLTCYTGRGKPNLAESAKKARFVEPEKARQIAEDPFKGRLKTKQPPTEAELVGFVRRAWGENTCEPLTIKKLIHKISCTYGKIMFSKFGFGQLPSFLTKHGFQEDVKGHIQAATHAPDMFPSHLPAAAVPDVADYSLPALAYEPCNRSDSEIENDESEVLSWGVDTRESGQQEGHFGCYGYQTAERDAAVQTAEHPPNTFPTALPASGASTVPDACLPALMDKPFNQVGDSHGENVAARRAVTLEAASETLAIIHPTVRPSVRVRPSVAPGLRNSASGHGFGSTGAARSHPYA